MYGTYRYESEIFMDNDRMIREIKEQHNREYFKTKSLFSIYEFQELVASGEITDEIGVAHLVIDDELRPEYNIFIDHRVITKTGTVISFLGLLKMYGAEHLAVKCVPRTF